MERSSDTGIEGWSLLWRDGANGASSDGVLRKQGDWERRMEAADGQQAELSHFQWGLVRDQVASLGRELANVRGDLDCVVRDQRNFKEDMDRKACGNRDLILQLEQKVQQELFKHSAEQRARHGELRNHSCGLADQLKDMHGIHESALADLHNKHQVSDAALRDLLAELEGKHGAMHSSVTERLQAVHELQSAESERLHDATNGLRSDHASLFESERADRAHHHSTLQDRLEMLERQLVMPKAVLVRPQPPQMVTMSSPFRVETSPMRQRAFSASPLASFSTVQMQPTVQSPTAGLVPFRSGPGVFAAQLGPGGRAASFAFGSQAAVAPPGSEDRDASEAWAAAR